MDIKEIKKQFKELSDKMQDGLKDNPNMSVLLNSLILLFGILISLVSDMSKQAKEQTKKLDQQAKQLEKQAKQIEKLTEAIANKTLTNKRVSSENINGRKSEKNKGVDSSDKNRDVEKTKVKPPRKRLEVEYENRYIGHNGQEFTEDEANKLIGTVFEGSNGKKYRYTRKLASSTKNELNLKLREITYYKLEYVEVDDLGVEVLGAKKETAVSSKTDFLKKTPISTTLMAYIVYMWIALKCPLNRVATHLYELGINVRKQQLYKYVDITSALLMPVYIQLKSHLKDEKWLCVDETYYSTREKLKDSEQEDKPPNGKRKSQKSLSKSMRSYMYGIVGSRVCIYQHDIYRDTDIPKNILMENGVGKDTFIDTDGLYRENFGKDGESTLFMHGLCWVHTKRYFCVVLNYATDILGKPIKQFVDCKWEQDIEDTRIIVDKISNAFHIMNDITRRCNNDNSLDIVALKNKELRPIIEDIFSVGRHIYEDIKCKKDEDAKRDCSKYFRQAITYLVNNEKGLKTFLDSPYGLMHTTSVEEKFRELDILRNSMMASDTIKGAENLALYYSLYKTAKLNGIEFEKYIDKCFCVMTEHMHQIEFAKDERGTITDFKSHSIPSEILESLMPWNMAEEN